jgi:N utilization substance protein B
MGDRRKARELALQALYFFDMRPQGPPRKLELFLDCYPCPANSRAYFLDVVNGVTGHRADLDATIERFSSNWKISRMPCVDRNVIRIAVYELLRRGDIPAKVSINEAVDIGKKYGTAESGAFINGILDGIHNALMRGEIVPITKAVQMSPHSPETEVAEPAALRSGKFSDAAGDEGSQPVAITIAPGLRKRRARKPTTSTQPKGEDAHE